MLSYLRKNTVFKGFFWCSITKKNETNSNRLFFLRCHTFDTNVTGELQKTKSPLVYLSQKYFTIVYFIDVLLTINILYVIIFMVDSHVSRAFHRILLITG